MASITKRGRYWRAQIVRRGYPPQYRTFDSRSEAEAWGRVLEGLFGIPVRAGIPLGGAWASLLTATVLALLLLRRKLKAFEVVR